MGKEYALNPEQVTTLKERALLWAAKFPISCFLDSNNYPEARYDWLLGVGEHAALTAQTDGTAFDSLQNLADQHTGQWLFGFLSYDLKNETEPGLRSENPNLPAFPAIHFFQPETVLICENGTLRMESTSQTPEQILAEIEATQIIPPKQPDITPLQARIPRPDYLNIIEAIREHIAAGDLYEMNFCQEFYNPRAFIQPLSVFRLLNQRSPSPFAAFYRADSKYLLCASPERFLQKRGKVLRSQPIKGTIARNPDAEIDHQQREQLRSSIKDRAEHVMIVDLVRNDLARSCLPGTVQVEELFGLHPFPQVWQMISTVRGELRPEVHPIRALARAFPMGSMTGAPKRIAMELIEHYEASTRGLYSGSVGYINPEGDFDFNVVIRSLLYEASQGYLSAQVGGAIVYDSDPEAEYEECLLKSSAIRAILEKSF
jgi:para-aminobenzoate synthetase component 1